jgi:parallel beta-helix repeat protein
LRAAGTDRTFHREIRGIRVHRRLPLTSSLIIALVTGVCSQAPANTFTVTSAADSGTGTLRDAITQANDETSNPGPDTIEFAIPGTGVPNIALASPLAVTSIVTINGATQAAGAVEISGGGTVDGGLLLSGGSSTVSGLVLNSFVSYAIQLATAGGNTVAGCIVGLDPTGTMKVGADMVRGIWVNGSPGNIIGGTSQGAGNVLSGNANGVAIENAGSTGNKVQGNVIGLGTDGSTLQNSTSGVRIALGATATVVGSTSLNGVGRNVISGNAIGVSLRDAASQSNQVEGNYIGTDATGTKTRANGTGILVFEANKNTIGGTGSGAGNVVSGNTGVGIDVQGVANGGNKIFGNLVGTTATGTAPLPNASGIRLLNCTAANHVGTAGGGNVISGNTGNGVNISNSNGQFVQGNVIGTTRDGSTAIPNGLNGVQVTGNGTTIGGGESNLIASNTQSGVLVKSGTGNTITGNDIHDNGGRGIDLGGNGFLPNDPLDADTGANDLQNFPDLTPLVPVSATSIPGTLDSTPTTMFTVEVFSNTDCPNGNGQGETSLGTVTVTTDTSGHASFSLSLVDPLAAGLILTATATAPDGSTSEFSLCTAPVGATATTTTTPTTRPPHTTTSTTATATTTTSPGQSTTTAPGHTVTSTTVPPEGTGPCPSDTSFASLECRLDALVDATRAAPDLGRVSARILKQLAHAASVTRDADALCSQHKLRPTRARLKRARRLVTVARGLLAPRRGSVAADASVLANEAGAIGDDLKTLRLQLRCAGS